MNHSTGYSTGFTAPDRPDSSNIPFHSTDNLTTNASMPDRMPSSPRYGGREMPTPIPSTPGAPPAVPDHGSFSMPVGAAAEKLNDHTTEYGARLGDHELHNRGASTTDHLMGPSNGYGSSPRPDGFARLGSTPPPTGYGYPPQGYPPPSSHANFAPAPPGTYPPPPPGTYNPYLYPPPQAPQPYGHQRNFFMRMLLGPVTRPWFSWLTALAMLALLIIEFVQNHQLTGSVIQTTPVWNPMIGPTSNVLIHLGARYVPCMRPLPDVNTDTQYAYCYRNLQDTCSLEELCGFGGFDGTGVPNQSFRFILPIFLHAGILHFLMNMLTHLRLGSDLERALGYPRYIILYMAAGIWGFVLSAMFSPRQSASMGCSGALFGLIGYMLIDVLINWKVIPHPWRDLMSLLISTIISLVLGLLPGLDNFAHIGGFAVGILMGILIAPMRPMSSKPFKMATWAARIVALVLLIVMFTVTIKQFYSSRDPSEICPNCKYLSCLPVNNWCDTQTQ